MLQKYIKISFLQRNLIPVKSLYSDNVRGSDVQCSIQWFSLQINHFHQRGHMMQLDRPRLQPHVSGPITLFAFHCQRPV